MKEWIILTSFGIIFILLFIIIVMVIKKKVQKLEEEVRSKFSGKTILMIDKFANFAGQESKGLGQVRGNGILVFVKDMIYFQMLTPKIELEIPREKITGFSRENSFLGKMKGIPLIKIDFRNKDGRVDSAGWWVKSPDEWEQVMGEMLSRRTL